MRKRRSAFVCIVGALMALTAISQAAPLDSMVITVNPGARQKFGGLGFNLADNIAVGWSTNAANQTTFIKNMITYSRFKNITLWGNGWMSPGSSTAPDTTGIGIKADFLNLLSSAQESGADFFMLNPINDRVLESHVRFWARCAKMWNNRGIKLNAMTFLNKPNTGRGSPDSGKRMRPPSEIAAGVKLLRKTLDSLGLQNTGICSPSVVEWHPRTWFSYGDRYDFLDGDTLTYMNALTSDPQAMAALKAIDLQAYGMGVSDWSYNIAKTNNKELWVTFSATDAPEEWDVESALGKNCITNGPITAATCLGCLNNGASRWNFWVMYNLVKSASATNPVYYGRLYYMANISRNFDQGAEFRQCTSIHPRQPSPTMRWSYNLSDTNKVLPLQDDIFAAAAQNPDSTWAVGLVNMSKIRSQHKASDTLSGQARTYRVTIQIPELQHLSTVRFTSTKCVDMTGIKDGSAATMTNGSMTVEINPFELIVFKSEKAASNILASRGNHRAGGILRLRESGRGLFQAERVARIMRISVVSVDGRIVSEKTWDAGSTPVVDLRGASAGSYVVTATSGGKVQRERIFVR